MKFAGRQRELALLRGHLDRIRQTGEGEMIAVRGRRRVGKSRLVSEFVRASGCPSLYFTATQLPSEVELSMFLQMAEGSDLPRSQAIREGMRPTNWSAALEFVVEGATKENPVVLVIDELPYLAASEPAIEATLQRQWDHVFQHHPVLVLLIGSDEAMMEALTQYSRPLFDRAREMVIKPLNPLELGELIKLDPAEALDSQLVIGGFPVLALERSRYGSLDEYVRAALLDPTSYLVVSGERVLAAEFPEQTQARQVLSAIGNGARSHRKIRDRAGIPTASLERSLEALRLSGLIERRLPYSTLQSTRLTVWEVTDRYMRFWLRFIDGRIHEIEAGRGEILFEDFRRSRQSYRGRAIEQLVRESIEVMLPDQDRFGPARHIGGFWNRSGTIEIDLVGGDKLPAAGEIGFVGSIKWREGKPFGREDVVALAAMRDKVPGAGAPTKLVGVSANGFDGADALDLRLGPVDLVEAWRP